MEKAQLVTDIREAQLAGGDLMTKRTAIISEFSGQALLIWRAVVTRNLCDDIDFCQQWLASLERQSFLLDLFGEHKFVVLVYSVTVFAIIDL